MKTKRPTKPEETPAAQPDAPDGWAELYAEAPERLTLALRNALAELAGSARGKYGDAVATRLSEWAREARIENLAEWLAEKGWDAIAGNQTLCEAIEGALVEDWNARKRRPAFVPFFVNHEERIEAMVAQYQADGTIIAPEAKLGAAFLGIARGEDLPEVDAEWTAVAALEGLRALLERRQWHHIASILPTPDPLLPRAEWKAETDRQAIYFPIWLQALADPWMVERALAEADRQKRQEEAAELAAAPAVHVNARKYGRLPKVTAGLSWAFGGPGVRLTTVTLDGKTYAPAPDLAIVPRTALVPAAYALLPADHAKKPHQTLLPIDLAGGEDAPPLPVAIADATQYALAPAAGKIGLLVLAAAHAAGGKLARTTLRELTQSINPDARLVRSHFETVARALWQLDGLRLVLPDGMAYRVFETPVPWRDITTAEYDSPLFVGLTRTFERTLAAIHDFAGASYRGDFLFSLSGAMRLPTKRPGLVRQYIRAAAFWNSYWRPGSSGEPDPSRVPEVETERWAAMTNYLSPTAAEYLRSKGQGDRSRLAHSIRDTMDDAKALAEQGLVTIGRLDRKAVRLLPPPEYIEAWHESRKGGHLIPGGGAGAEDDPKGKNPRNKRQKPPQQKAKTPATLDAQPVDRQ